MPFMGGPLDGQEVNPDTLAQADEGGGLDLEALMAGIGGGGDPMAGGPPPELGPPPSEAPSEDVSEDDRIKRVLDDLMFLSSPQSSFTEQERVKTQNMMSLLQGIRGSHEKMEDDAMSGKMSPQLLKKQYAGAAGG